MYIMDMLGLFAMTSDVTRMDISSLAAVFAPVNGAWIDMYSNNLMVTQNFFSVGRAVTSRR